VSGLLMRAWPLIAVSSAAGAVGLLPVLPASGGFQGDLILLLALLELPSMCIIAAGFSSRSIFGEIGSAREAVLSVSYNIVFLLAILSIAASQHTFSLSAMALLPASPLRLLGIVALLVCLPAKLHLNPFSLPNAEQEIYSGPMTEYAGPELAMWELSHGLEWVAATGLVATLIAPAFTLWWVAALVFVALSFAIVLLLSVVASATARLQIDTTVRFYWQCTLIFAVLAVAAALFMRLKA
jgi:NADH-quinone oxidoreductase subunit H